MVQVEPVENVAVGQERRSLSMGLKKRFGAWGCNAVISPKGDQGIGFYGAVGAGPAGLS
jgi:hypothetical protein